MRQKSGTRESSSESGLFVAVLDLFSRIIAPTLPTVQGGAQCGGSPL